VVFVEAPSERLGCLVEFEGFRGGGRAMILATSGLEAELASVARAANYGEVAFWISAWATLTSAVAF